MTLLTMLFPALLLLFSGLVAGLPVADGEIERGVRVAGVDVSGADWEATASQFQAHFDSYLSTPLTLQFGQRQVQATPAELGIGVDMQATMRRAEAVGRGSWIAAAGERLKAHTRGVDIDPVVTIDDDRFVATLTRLAAPDLKAPVDATYAWQSGRIRVIPSADGVGIDTSAVAEAIRRQVIAAGNTPVRVQVLALSPAISTDTLNGALNDAMALAGKPVLLGFNGTLWQLDPADLVPMLTMSDGHVALDRQAFGALIGTLSASIDQPARNATIEFRGDGTFGIVPEQPKRTLDVPASVDAAVKALASNNRQAALVVDSEAPAVTTARVQPLLDRANEIMQRGMLVTWPDGEQWLDPTAWSGTIRFDEINGALTFDHTALAELIDPIAETVNRPASGLRWRNGELVGIGDGQAGRVVDLGATANAVASAALGGQSSAPLVINESSDPAQSASSIVIREVLGSASTYYGSSSANRRTNVELAAASLDGALVAPGGTFSFNNAIGGTATLDDGYQMGFGIITGSDGTPKTVPSVAGGICQVATTVFQAAFWSGMPIGIRNWHLYWIPNYGTGPGGLTGLDATVDPDSGLDFTFDNPTSDWLAIRAVADGEWLTVEVWGTNQGWQVQVDPPMISNVVKADQTMHRQISDELEPGQEIVVEHAEDGFNASIHRVVFKDGQVVNDVTLDSYYLPSRNVTLVGPGGSVDGDPTPTVVPEETPVVEDTPTPEETPTPENPDETPVVEDTPIVEDTPTTDASPVVEDTPVTEESPTSEP